MMAAAWQHLDRDRCPHLRALAKSAVSDRTGCEACGGTEDLRVCLACGYVGCCESHAAHNTAHYRSTKHPVIRPHRCAYDWLWCYECSAFLD